MAPRTHRITTAEARRLAAAEAAVAAARVTLKRLERDREAQRDKLRPRLPAGEFVTAADVTIKRSESETESFSLKGYRDAGHKLTAAMRKFVSHGRRETWTVQREAPVSVRRGDG